MVSRHETLCPVVAVDLDGTLLRANSFKLYIRVGLKTTGAARRAALLAATAVRKLKIISHNHYRAICCRLIGFSREVLDKLGEAAAAYRSATVGEFIREKEAEGYRILLATAAMDKYVPALWRGEYVASHVENNRIVFDCRGEAKLEKVLKYLDGATPEYFISDSLADRPLFEQVLAHAGHALLADPTTDTLRPYNPSKRQTTAKSER